LSYIGKPGRCLPALLAGTYAALADEEDERAEQEDDAGDGDTDDGARREAALGAVISKGPPHAIVGLALAHGGRAGFVDDRGDGGGYSCRWANRRG
jgi:hypothetical protein